MRPLHFVVATALVIFTVGGCYAQAGFTYDNQSAWKFSSNPTCGSNRQSPVDIIVRNTVPAGNELKRLQLQGWETPVSGTVSYKPGVTITFSPKGPVTKIFTHRGEYKLLNFHFHWGDQNGRGSEHTVNGVQYDGELHFVHSKFDQSASNTDVDYLTVIGVFLQSSETAPVAGTIWEKVMKSTGIGQNIMSGITYTELLPTNRSYFYYEGSLTIPPCSETVQWMVLQNPIQVPAEILRKLRSLPADTSLNTTLATNYRDVQPLNDRKVLRFTNSGAVNSPFCYSVIATAVLAVVTLLL